MKLSSLIEQEDKQSLIIRQMDVWMKTQGLKQIVMLQFKPNYLDTGKLHLELINVDHKKQKSGIGSHIMRKLIGLCDHHGVDLTLEASELSLTGDNKKWLQSWYSDLGFEYHDEGMGDHGPFMIRRSNNS